MKVTPLAGSGIGAVTSGTGTVSPDKREAAKQAFLGQTRTAIAPSDTPVDPTIQATERNIRKIRMNTNASPDRIERELPVSEQESFEASTKSAIPDDGTQTVETEVTRPISPQFAELARQRRALQVKEREIAEKEKSLSEKAATSEGIPKEQIKANPLKILMEAGVTYEQLTEAILADQSGINPEVQALKAKIDALEKGVESKFTERDTRAEQNAVAQIHRDVEVLVAEGDDFELIRGKNYQRKVTDLIHKQWKATGKVLDVQEAATLIEEELYKEATQYASFKKVQSKLTPAVETITEEPNRLRTLTNRQTATPAVSARARALAAFNGTLKK